MVTMKLGLKNWTWDLFNKDALSQMLVNGHLNLDMSLSASSNLKRKVDKMALQRMKEEKMNGAAIHSAADQLLKDFGLAFGDIIMDLGFLVGEVSRD